MTRHVEIGKANEQGNQNRLTDDRVGKEKDSQGVLRSSRVDECDQTEPVDEEANEEKNDRSNERMPFPVDLFD